jgi:hypothetical protein
MRFGFGCCNIRKWYDDIIFQIAIRLFIDNPVRLYSTFSLDGKGGAKAPFLQPTGRQVLLSFGQAKESKEARGDRNHAYFHDPIFGSIACSMNTPPKLLLQ